MSIGKRISDLRKQYSYSQEYVADKVNVSRQAVSKWERGESLPDVTVLKQIADLFHVTVDSLLSDDQPQPAPAVRHNRQRIFQLVTAISQLPAKLIAVSASSLETMTPQVLASSTFLAKPMKKRKKP